MAKNKIPTIGQAGNDGWIMANETWAANETGVYIILEAEYWI